MKICLYENINLICGHTTHLEKSKAMIQVHSHLQIGEL